MSGYRIVVGADATALNRLSSVEYGILYPTYLKRTVPIGMQGVESLSYDVQAAPTFSGLGASDDETLQCTVTAGAVALTVIASSGASYTWPAQLTALCSVALTSPDLVRLQVVNGSLAFTSTPPDPFLQKLINDALLPALVQELDEQWLTGGILPLQFDGLDLAFPVLAVQGGVAVAFVSKVGEPAPVVPPPGTAWPRDVVFILADVELLDDLVELGVAPISVAGNYHLEVAGLTLVAGYFLGLSQPRLEYAPSAPIPAQLTAGGVGVLSIRIGSRTIDSMRFLAAASPSFDAELQVSDGSGEARLVIDDVRGQDVRIEIPGLPAFLQADLVALERALNGPATTLLLDLLLKIQNTLILYLPSLQISIADVTLDVGLQQVETTGVVDASGTPRLGFTGLFSLTPSGTSARALAKDAITRR